MTGSGLRHIVLPEWTQRMVSDLHLTQSDFDRVAALGDSRLGVIELREGVRIESRGWIGVVGLECCTIQVEPRLIDGHRNLVALLDYVRGLSLLEHLDRAGTFDAGGETLFDLMAWLLADACDGVLRAGVQADYVPLRDELTALRGRLDVRAQVLRRWGRLDRLVCDYEDRVREIPENRWLLRALRAARRGVRSPRIEAMVRRAAATWEELCEDDASEVLDKPIETRTNQHYREALELAYLVLDGVTASDLLHSGPARGFSFMLNMPRLFEEFVSTVLDQILSAPGVRVQRQAADRSILWDVDERKPFGSVRPDIVVVNEAEGTRLPIDAKYKDYDNEKLQSGDVYQSAIYALAMSSQAVPGWPKRCLLLYPSRDTSEASGRVQVRIGGQAEAEILRLGLPVGALLDELRRGVVGKELTRIVDACTEVASPVVFNRPIGAMIAAVG